MKPDLSPVHPELRAFAAKMPQVTFSRKNLWIYRVFDRLIALRPTPKDISVVNLFIPIIGEKKDLRLRVYHPQHPATPLPALLWLHGGGFIAGSPEQDDSYCLSFARELEIVVVSVDYRRAPEHPFPSPLDDCYTALEWMVSHAALLGIDPQRIAIGGESGGAGLAAGLAQLAFDREDIHPVCQLLIYPMLDDRSALRTDLKHNELFAWNTASNRFGWESYLHQPCGSDAPPAGAVPARRINLTGLPPAWIGVGTLDLFHAEDVAYAHSLIACGVACELVVVPGAFHGFDLAGPGLQIVRDFHQSQIDTLKKYLFPAETA
jgi:acetyl esterase/lipase